MNFQDQYKDYLYGEKFSSALSVDISNSQTLSLDRLDFLEEIARNQRILHMGCVDHTPLIREKIAQNRWLHGRLTKVAKKCVGFDINKEGIQSLKELGFDNAYYFDLFEERQVPKIFEENHWDYIILGEILEHTDNPVDFLRCVKRRFMKNTNRIIITVPNAFRILNFLQSAKNKEYINSDHRYWFTPYTLAKVVTLAGFRVEKLYLTNSHIPKRNFLKKAFLKKMPLFNDSLIMIAMLK